MHIKVDHVETLGADTLVHGHLDEDHSFVTVRLPDIHHFKKGAVLPFTIPPKKTHLFDKDKGNRIGEQYHFKKKTKFSIV